MKKLIAFLKDAAPNDRRHMVTAICKAVDEKNEEVVNEAIIAIFAAAGYSDDRRALPIDIANVVMTLQDLIDGNGVAYAEVFAVLKRDLYEPECQALIKLSPQGDRGFKIVENDGPGSFVVHYAQLSSVDIECLEGEGSPTPVGKSFCLLEHDNGYREIFVDGRSHVLSAA